MDEFILATEFLTEFDYVPQKEYKVKAVVLVKDNKFFNGDLMGKRVVDYVLDAVKTFEPVSVDFDDAKSLTENIECFSNKADYLLVLYGNTPFVDERELSVCLDYATTKNLDICYLPQGAIVKSSALALGNFSTSATANFVKKGNFFAVEDNLSLLNARDRKKKEIVENLAKSGVEFLDGTAYVESGVEFGKNVVVGPNCVIRGKTKIGDNAKIEENCVIQSAEIGKNVTVLASCVRNCKIKDGSKIGPFENIGGSK